jgi:hypothetical protein
VLVCLLPSILREDNTGAMFLLKNDPIGARTKLKDIRHRFVNDMIKEKTLDVEYIASENNPADIMTKNVVEALAGPHSKSIYEGRLWEHPNKEDVKERVTTGSIVVGCQRI